MVTFSESAEWDKIVTMVTMDKSGISKIVIFQVWYYQKQKFLYDETWIIDWDNIKPSTGYKGFGSVRSIQSTMLSQTSMGQNGGINPPPVRGQIFCDTGIL